MAYVNRDPGNEIAYPGSTRTRHHASAFGKSTLVSTWVTAQQEHFVTTLDWLPDHERIVINA